MGQVFSKYFLGLSCLVSFYLKVLTLYKWG